MKSVLAALVMVAGVAAAPVAQNDTGPLGTAKDLYASARYDEALSVLNELRGANPIDRKSVEQYRSLCLLALGRASEAEGAIAAVVTADPTYRPGEAEASPRVRSAFTDVRRRLLPEIATARYVEARATFDRREWASAEEQFTRVLSLIDDPDTGGRLGDLRVLTLGFLELSARAAAPPPPTAAPVTAEAPSGPPAQSPSTDGATPAAAGKIYEAEDEGITPAMPVKQEIPAVPSGVVRSAKPRGILELIIDEQGRPVSLTVRTSIHPSYDTQLVAAARDWKYRPATLNGQPVKFRKLIQIAVKR
jgi:tetratricopeptide (TPR) repeat protein